ncbi:ABC transporter ATP-binding protein/permease [Mesobacillus maritimus]|uniref:ABC transporter ATP-binding protein n=1 Tax=Mesobacillus maritimus TaxID=1643336 RepID=UPI00203C0D6E|nr:ABC transporter ATP-binding protein [Mesobacillus maritimus]MCM3669150.1 ABC transporter ATP-binding protein/permease [Mesobacillus maritimus]
MKKVLSLLKPYRLPMAIAIVLMLIELAVELWQPLLMAQIIDQGIAANDLHTVIKYGGIMLGISLLAFIAGITNSFFAAYASQNFGYDLRKNLYEKVQSFSFANFNKFPTSSLITRMTNDVNQLQMTLFMSLRIALRAPLLVIGGIVMALSVNFKLALGFVLVIPPLFVFLFWIMRRSTKLFKLVQGKLDQVNSVMRENLSGIRLIRAFSRGSHESQRFKRSNQELMDRTVFALRITETAIPVLLFFLNITVLVVLWFGNLDINNGTVSVGEVVAVVNYTARITTAFSMFSWIIMVYSRAIASTGRIEEVLDSEADLYGGLNKLEMVNQQGGRIEFEHVSFRYPDTKADVLSDIHFRIESGETVAVLGATGSGKSSLFQLIPRLYDTTEGTVKIDGVDVRTLEFDHLRKQIGYVPQEALLFTGSIKDNLAWGKEDASLEEMIQATEDAQIHKTITKLPEQYDTMIGQKGVNLSGGQKQRLSIARALIKKPRILLLDDSTSALDLKTEAKLLDALKQYQCTTLIITQKTSTAKEADQILILEDGKMIAAGDHHYLMDNSKLYQDIYRSQQSLIVND